MTHTHFLAVAVSLTLPVGALAGTLGTMTPVSDDRFVSAVGDPVEGEFCGANESNRQDPVPDFSLFDASVSAGAGGYASQTSSVGTDQLAGSGYASGASDLCWGVGTSLYDVSFTLDSWATLDLSGSIESIDEAFGYGETTATLLRAGQVRYQEVADPYSGPVALSYTEAVQPGSYRLVIDGNGEIWISSNWSFTLDADPAAPPVPALGSTGLNALVALLASAGGAAARRSG